MLKKNIFSKENIDKQWKKFSLDTFDHISCFITLLKLVKQYPLQLSINEQSLIIKSENATDFLSELIIRLVCIINGGPLTFYYSDLENGWVYDFSPFSDEVDFLNALVSAKIESTAN